MEIVRRVLRAALPLSVYKILATITNFLAVLAKCPLALRGLYFSSKKSNELILSGILYPFFVRNNPADKNVVIQNLVRHECLPCGLKPRYVIDAGGYIGDSAALYLSKWPNCRCIVLEPSANHEIASKNLAPYGKRVRLLKAFLGRHSGTGSVEEALSGSKIDSLNGDIPIITVEQVLDLIPGGKADFLKIDIEGAELELLRPPISWISRIDSLAIELHGPEIERPVKLWLSEYGFICKKRRSIHFFTRK